MKKQKVSEQTVVDAMAIAKATQRPGQTKEQTKLIAQGIQKGIDLYKKQQKAKQREQDRLRKKQAKEKQSVQVNNDDQQAKSSTINWLPWTLLVISWIGFLIYFVI
jgi:hypothetical protein